MFVGREKELEQLKKEFKKKEKSAILIYGRRRIGKSTLIAEALKGFDGIVINHTCVQSSYDGNLELLYRSVSQAMSLPQIKFEHLLDLFEYLGKQKNKVALVLDEYTYLKEAKKKKEIDSYMQVIIDGLSSNIKLILCGSYISVMRELLEEDNPLFGRFTQVFKVGEFDYYDASGFYPEASTRAKLERYAFFGGSPYILSNLDDDLTMGENIIARILPETGMFRTYIESIALQEVRKSYDVRILEILGNGRRKYSEMVTMLNSTDNGYLDKQLKSLLSMDVIQKEFPINRSNDKKKQFYSISDNLMRFFFTFIFGNSAIISSIGEENFYEQFIYPKLTNFVSLRFEEIARQYFRRQARLGKIKGIEDIGTYWYDDKKNRASGQFDCVVKRNSKFDFYECKFYEKPMKKSECDAEAEKVRTLLDIETGRTGFICSSGFDFRDDEYELITGDDLFK